MKQTREARNRPINIVNCSFAKEQRKSNEAKTGFLTSTTGTTGHPHKKNESRNTPYILHKN